MGYLPKLPNMINGIYTACNDAIHRQRLSTEQGNYAV